jgi:ATP-dependent Clp protease adaptor protein ClpS
MSESDSKKDSSDVAVAEPPKAKEKPRPKPASPKQKPKFQPPYAVVVLNDDDHTYEYVIDTLCRVCGHSTQKAFKLAQEIDKTGRAVVWTGSMEVAELKRDQIKGMGPDFYASRPVTYPLGVHIEPMPQ